MPRESHAYEPSPRWRRYLRFWRSDVEADVREEIAFHLDGLIAQEIAAGASEQEARRAAERRFGNQLEIAAAMRDLATQREIDMRRSERFHDFVRDLAFARRQLVKRPLFTLVAVITLALGIGANTAIFSAVNAVLLRPLPVRDIDQLTFIHANLPKLPVLDAPIDPIEVLAMTASPGVFQAVAGHVSGNPVLSGGDEARRLSSAQTVGRFFEVFGVTPALGRFHRPEESIDGRHRVVVLSHDFWRELGSNPSIIGRRLEFTSGTFEVIGVAPKGFEYPRGVHLWMPFRVTPDHQPYGGRMIMTAVGRLRPATTPAELDAWLGRTAETLHPGVANLRQQMFFSSRSFVSEIAGDLRPALLALTGAVAFVLLIACANVASLQLVHGSARAREMAVRAAIGADRGAIVRQLLVENGLLSVLGGLLGLVVAVLILKLLAVVGGAELSALNGVRLDGRVLGFTAIATIACGLLFGVVPAIRASRVDLQSGLKEGGRGQSFGVAKHRLLHAGVMLQMALTLMLLMGSALMIRTMANLLAEDPGFRASQVATMRISASGPRYGSAAARRDFLDAALARISGFPGVEVAGMVSELPFSGASNSNPFTIEGAADDPAGGVRHANLRVISGDYFRAMGIPLIRGRLFTSDDAPTSTPVAVIDEQLARQYFGSEDPIGKQIRHGGPVTTVVGIVGSVSHEAVGEPAKATAYYPFRQRPWYSSMYVTLRTPLALGTLTSSVRGLLKAVDPNAPVFEPRMLTERVNASLAPRRLATMVLAGLAAVSLFLAVFGLYGVISYVVSQRTTEFAIRTALGAQRRDVRGMVVKQGVVLAIGGIAIGMLAATAATTALGALLSGVSAHDPLTFILGPIALCAVAVGASYLPALRATRVSPLDALRRGE